MATTDLTVANERGGQLLIGVLVRPLGAFPSGWRYPGAHKNPAHDPQALKRLARTAEKAGLDYLFLGDWLSASADLEYTEPHLLARIDPLSSAAYLAAVTSRIGIIGTASTAHTEPYAIARMAASIDRLSGGRFGLNLTVGTDPQAEANFGRPGDRAAGRPGSGSGSGGGNRFEAAVEFVDVLRRLWDSWGDGAFVSDARSGQLLDRSLISPIAHVGTTFEVAGPLNALRPVQGHVPLMHAGSSPRAKEFAAVNAEIYVVAPSSLAEAVAHYREAKQRVAALGRDPSELSIVAPILPVVGETRAQAHEIYDRLVDLVQLDEPERPALSGIPPNRTVGALLQSVGLPLLEKRPDDVVAAATAERFNAGGRRLVQTAAARSGRTIGGPRPLTYRHLLVAQLIPAPMVVGSAVDIADHFEAWYRAGAVDGFTVQSAFLHEQFEAFTALVVPELQARGLFRSSDGAKTLRGRLGLSHPQSAQHPSPASPAQPPTRRRNDQADLVQPVRDEHRGPHLARALGAS
jgi:FMN-dependent oxidoreductase (nitrilotriacetate monooxygenase family)